MSKKPNILWIQTDEQRPDSLGCYGSAWAKTPYIDSIAQNGTVMMNAVCNSPVCLPSRSSQLSARYPHEFGCLNNMIKEAGQTFPDDYMTFPELFREAGYETLNFGRFHCMSDHVFETNKITPDIFPEVGTHFELNSQFDESYYNVIKRPGKRHRPLIIAGTYPPSENPCQRSTDRAIAYLENHQENNQPFLLRVSYNWPHTPTLVPEPYNRMYNPDELPIRFYDEASYRGRAKYDRNYADLHNMKELTKDEVRQMWADYMGLCAYVDHEVGRVLAALNRLGLRENTIILFSSDHGKMLGEWGTGEKGSFDQQVWRVPFIWSWPGHIPMGHRNENVCELIDTARTLMELAQIEERIPSCYKGRNLFDQTTAKNEVFGVIRPPIHDIPDFDPRMMRIGVLNDKYRMDVNWFLNGERPEGEFLDGNLFDLQNDSSETKNLFTDPKWFPIVDQLCESIKSFLAEATCDSRLTPENAGKLF